MHIKDLIVLLTLIELPSYLHLEFYCIFFSQFIFTFLVFNVLDSILTETLHWDISSVNKDR